MNQVIKRRMGLIAAALVVVMVLTGTYAWQSFGQRAFNAAWYDAETNYGGRIHDHYDGEGYGFHNKDVFAENFGDNPLFVRVRLREFLSINGVPVIDTMDITNPSTWPYYQSVANRVNEPYGPIALLHGEMPEGYGIRWYLGHNQPTYFMPTHNHATYQATHTDGAVPAIFDRLDAYQMSNASGRAVDGLATDAAGVAFDVTDVAHARDFWLNGVQTAPGDGSHNFWGPNPTAQTHDAYLIYTYRDESTGNTYVRRSPELVTHTAQRNLLPSIDLPTTAEYDARILSYLGVSRADFRGVMTMQNWLDLYQPAGNFWILDSDGWFYWNGFVPAGEATSLLLDAIYLPNRGTDSWQHVIEVEADFFSTASLDDVVGMSANAALIFYGLETSPQPTTSDVDVEEDEELED